jgi:hypothetical protein
MSVVMPCKMDHREHIQAQEMKSLLRGGELALVTKK